ncbi:hypothetical protein BRC92_06235 [Halobacteriales archaeon QS_4_69_31]|nr:MAG: hypothetical protein BRC92_06235 [Halobacteriales archaeon QS_4_69_31]
MVEVPRARIDLPDLVVVVVGADEVGLVFLPEVVCDPREARFALFVVVGLADEGVAGLLNPGIPVRSPPSFRT